ncbi:MAG: glycosyltransferase [Geobacter sp.]|nr:glycosyltransferase [Geobacter sp.]
MTQFVLFQKICQVPLSKSLFVRKDGAMVDILIPNFDDLGAQRVAINAANGLATRGYSVRFVVTKRTGPFEVYLDPGIEIVDLGAKVVDIPKFRIGFWMLAYLHFLRKYPSDTIISFAPIMNLFGVLAKAVSPKMHVIIQEHAYQSVALKDRSCHSLKYELMYRVLLVKLYRIADMFITISHMIKNDFVDSFKLPCNMIHVIPNPIDIDKIITLSKEPVTEFDFKLDITYLIGVGRLTAQKNFHRLIRIFASVVSRRNDVQLIILGRGEDRESLLELADSLGVRSKVHLLGFMQNPYKFIAHSTIFCLTSDWEGLPQVIAEAMICNTPVIAHACPSGPSEMIEHGVTGELIPYKEEDLYVNSLLSIIGDGKLLTRYAQAAFSFAQEHYSTDKFIDRYEHVLKVLG